MNRIAALARKELYSYSISPVLYGIAVFFLLFVSIWLFYYQHFFAMDSANLRVFFTAFPLGFILMIPALTMKTWAEERKTGTMELLLTMPFSEWDLVLGKFLAAFGAAAGITVLTLPVPLSLLPLGNFDLGVIAGEYAGALLLAASSTALGLLLSCLARSQAGAFLGIAAALLAVTMVNQVARTFTLPTALSDALNFISLAFHFETFSKGIIDTRDLAFFGLSTLLFLFLNTRVLLFRKWR
jgi:ABC-2 type transport system permease protein